MKSWLKVVLLSACGCGAFSTAVADDPNVIGRFQLVVCHFTAAGPGKDEAIYKFDTATGKVWRLEQGSMEIPANKLPKGATVNKYGVEGWAEIRDSFTAALLAAQADIDKMPNN